MGKGYNNFMSKKAFHPGSYANQKRVHEAEAKAEAKRKHDEETLAQYLKEQELFNQKSMVSKESKEKLSLNFMYETPPGLKKPDEKQTDKIQWKGSGPSTSGSKTIDRLKPDPKAVEDEEPSICLEWKREKPTRRKLEIEEVEQKTIVKRETKVKVEPNIDLKWKREPKRESCTLQDSKRIKKER